MKDKDIKSKNKKLIAIFIIAGVVIVSFGISWKFNNQNKFEKDFYENDLLDGGMINVGLSIQTTSSIPSSQLIEIINNEYKYVVTSILNTQVRDLVKEPNLFLYRSIQGTWTNFDQFNWTWINEHENMFCHHDGNRIKTIYNSWLMNASDFVDPDRPDAMEHWINYYAITASQQIYSYGYDGIFIDSASHYLNPYAINNIIPDDYDENEWYNGRIEGLIYIKNQLQNKTVIYNGLHAEHGSEDSLNNTDGGMWENFAYDHNSNYKGKTNWLTTIELVKNHNQNKLISMVSKKKGMISDISSRIFIVSSYFLVWSENVLLNLVDFNIDTNGEFVYFPEYRINLGNPLGNYSVINGEIYMREFEKGIVLVNPKEENSQTYQLDGSYQEIIPVGGGKITEDGKWEGSLNYETISGEITLAPASGIILLKI